MYLIKKEKNARIRTSKTNGRFIYSNNFIKRGNNNQSIDVQIIEEINKWKQ